jgi:rhamnosyltransferase
MLIFFTILYNPSENALLNIRNAKLYGIHTAVYINKVSINYKFALEKEDILVLGSNVNDGLGVAFSALETYMKNSSYNFFIYFDQDTVVNKNCWELISKKYSKLFVDISTGLVNIIPSKRKNPKLVISSGSIFSMDILKKVGFHDHSYFVDGVDYEFCLRLKKNGYRIDNHHFAGIDHYSLQGIEKIKILGFSLAIRVYGRNRLVDFNYSHYRLLCDSFLSRQYIFFFLFLKSFFIFNFKEFFSRLAKACK